MKHAGIIGYPLSHSISPALHNAAYEAMGLDIKYHAWSTPPEEVAAAVRRLRGDSDVIGMQATVPHKQVVMAYLDEIEDSARAIGAVNTLERRDGKLVGHNTDKAGFIESLLDAGFPPKGKSVLILGYGGAERAVAMGLAEAGVTSIAITGRRQEGIAEALAQLRASSPFPMNLEAVSSGEDALRRACFEADLIVNCTPVGMLRGGNEDETPLPATMIHAGQWVCDLVYNPLETRLLREARAAGARTVDGLGMLVGQAARAIHLWTGERPPVDIMREAGLRTLAVQE